MKRFLFSLIALISLHAFSQTVIYPSQTGSYNITRTVNTNGSYFAGTYNNGGNELGSYANGNGGTYIGDPGAAIFHTFTTDGSGSGTARPMKVGDQFQITCYVGSSGNFFNNSSAGISFNGSTDYTAFSNYNTLQRAKFQINQNGGWFPATIAAGNGYANAGQDVTFTIKLTSAKTANLTISSANGATTYDMALANLPSVSGDNILSFALWNQTSGNANDMYWKNGSLTSTGTIEIGNGNASSTFDGAISDGLAANSSSVVKVNALTKAGSGTILLTAANTYTGTTAVNEGTLSVQNSMASAAYTLNGGTLQTNANNILADTASITLAGGTLSTGSGFTDTVGTLGLSASSTIALGSNNHALTFANSSGITWNSSATLTITGWNGIAGQSNATQGRIIVGTGGLTLAQRQKITFSGYPGTPVILATGELVPAPFYTVTASAGANGSIIPNGATTLENGSDITYTLTPDACYSIEDVLVDGNSIGAVSSYTFTNLAANHTIAATFSQNTFSINASAGADGTITPNGASSVACGSNATYTITPDACYSITDVMIDGVSEGAVGTYTFINVAASHTIAVTFSQNTYSITASTGANGSVTPNGTNSVNCGDNATFTITPNACYSIADVYVDGVSQGAVGTYTFTNVTAEHTISATFTFNTYPITANSGSNGTITPAGTTAVNCGDNATYTISADACYSIHDVIVDGVSQGAVGTYTFTNVTAAHTISALFSQNTFSITASAGPNGTITPNGASSGACGSNATYTITPDACYSIIDVMVDGVSQGAVGTYTFINVAASHTIAVTFSQNTYSITASAGANGSVTPNGANSVNCGDNATFTITPNACYSVADVIVDGISQGAVGVYTFTNVSAGHTISATFILNTYSISAAAGANGSITPSGSVSVNCGANQTFTISPNACAVIQDVVVDGVSQGAITAYTFTNVVSSHTISASFTATLSTFYADADGDGYGNAAVTYLGCAQPGYVTNSTDCNDANAAVYQNGTFYVDADGDNYTTGVTAVVCYGATTPVGYITANTAIDCNDAVAAINPGHAEVLYNGIDDNCNGQLDENSQLKTKLLAESCGATLASINSLIGITTVSSQITGYRIRVTNGASVQILEKTVPHFTLTELATYAYATTYTVEIELQRLGVWLGYYGDACLVSSPPVLTQGGATQVSPSQCGGTLARINTLIATTSLPGVTGYRFRVTNLTTTTGPNVVQVIDRPLHWFSLQMLAQYNYATTYQIEIAIKTTGTYGGYGGVCNITSPAAPSLEPCGGTIAASTTRVAATSLNGVTQYRFQIIRDSDNATTTIDRNTNYFTFAQVPAFTPSALYNVRVAVMTTGTWSPFGDACQITSPASVTREIAQPEAATATAPFNAVAYPNPFVEDIDIQITCESGKKAEVSIYDLAGRQIEKFEALSETRVGANYPVGVYTVTVTQGENSQVLRIIKR